MLIGGHRRPIAGTVTMDQILVDCGPGATVARGDEVVLIGRQGSETIGAWEWAQRTDTIAYEVVCGISERVPRRSSQPTGGLSVARRELLTLGLAGLGVAAGVITERVVVGRARRRNDPGQPHRWPSAAARVWP